MTTTLVPGLEPVLAIDGYKLSHRDQFAPGTEYVLSNWTPRGSRVEGVNEVTFFGLQYFLQHSLTEQWGEFFDGDIDAIVEGFQNVIGPYLGVDPSEVAVQHLRDLHALGYLPLEFRAVAEGTATPLRVPQFTVENTRPEFFWLTNYIETSLSNAVWLASTSATQAVRLRKMLNAQAVRSGQTAEDVAFQGHDFSFRGLGGVDAATLSGAAHLVAFSGTDTIPALDFIKTYYPTDSFLAASVPASEHATMCSYGQESEFAAYERLLDIYPTGFLSVVSDTYDFFGVITEFLPLLKDRIMARDGRIVLRPDSGVPEDILCGDPLADPESPEGKGAVQLLWELFGGTINEKGFKVLDTHIGLIYGDSITFERAQIITERLIDAGFASTNAVFGVGSFTYQYVTRDTFGFAFKATNVVIDGVSKAIFKNPKTDSGTKISAKGRLAVLRNDYGQLVLVDEATPEQEAASLLETVWKDGKFVKHLSFDEVRNNAFEE